MSIPQYRSIFKSLAPLFVVALAACHESPFVCTAELRFAIQLDILDSITRAPAAAGATILLRGPSVDSIVVPDPWTKPSAQTWNENQVKRGTYSIQIQKPGYRGWSTGNVEVQGDACHISTFEHVTALLQR